MRLSICLALLLACLPSGPASAQASAEQAGFVLYANALPTLDLTPQVALASGITRSRNRALLNIALRRRLDGGGDEAIAADVVASATNLAGQRQLLTLRAVREPGAIYYLAEPRIADEDTLEFEVEARPEGSTEVLRVRFRQSFFPPLPPR